uniref:Uncharacterized protein n=1 Tax=Solanum tuberosum TaxID=4113 RepID=M1DFP0_SOLTU
MATCNPTPEPPRNLPKCRPTAGPADRRTKEEKELTKAFQERNEVSFSSRPKSKDFYVEFVTRCNPRLPPTDHRVTHGPAGGQWMATCNPTPEPPRNLPKCRPIAVPTDRRTKEEKELTKAFQERNEVSFSSSPKSKDFYVEFVTSYIIVQLYSILYAQYLSSTDAYSALHLLVM